MRQEQFRTLAVQLEPPIQEHHQTIVHSIVDDLDANRTRQAIYVRLSAKWSGLFIAERLAEAVEVRCKRDARISAVLLQMSVGFTTAMYGYHDAVVTRWSETHWEVGTFGKDGAALDLAATIKRVWSASPLDGAI